MISRIANNSMMSSSDRRSHPSAPKSDYFSNFADYLSYLEMSFINCFGCKLAFHRMTFSWHASTSCVLSFWERYRERYLAANRLSNSDHCLRRGSCVWTAPCPWIGCCRGAETDPCILDFVILLTIGWTIKFSWSWAAPPHTIPYPFWFSKTVRLSGWSALLWRWKRRPWTSALHAPTHRPVTTVYSTDIVSFG